MITNIIKKFRDSLKSKPIQELLNIPLINNNYNSNREFHISIPYISEENDEIHIRIKFINNYKSFYLHFLPPEINEIISSFMNDTLILNFIISYPINYPFQSPYWSFDKYSCSVETKFNITRYYQNKLDYHNQINQRLVSLPSIFPEKDILGFVVIINQFDEIFNIIRNDC